MKPHNNKHLTLGLFMLLCVIWFNSYSQTPPPEPVKPLPTEDQIRWNEMERNAFIHFGLNTFTDKEWGYGGVPAAMFNPSELDAEQWCRVIKDAGLKGVVLTAKHHDGFCLWPSKYTEYSVKNSPWRDGNGDLVREVSDACKKYGLKFGVYLSPWDRNSAIYGSPEYIDYFRNQLTELLTNYGDIFEVWFDGANGGTGYYGGADEKRSVDRKTYYDWETTNALVKKLQPHALIFSDAGPDIRWCGNEHGEGGRTNWSILNSDEAWPGWPRYRELNKGHENGRLWVPAEINVSVRPGWFYHESENHQVHDLHWLVDYYYESVGRNGTGLLNFAVDTRGLIHEIDAQNVRAWQKVIESDFAINLLKDVQVQASNVRGRDKQYSPVNVLDDKSETYWATDDGVKMAALRFDFDQPITFNRFLVQEGISLGQRVKEFSIDIKDENGRWKTIAHETTIGYKRILRLPSTTTKAIRFVIDDAKASPVINNVALYNAPKLITSPEISRDKQGLVTISSSDDELAIYYSMDGSEPNSNSTKYVAPFIYEGVATINVVAIDEASNKQSSIVSRSFGPSKELWKIVGATDDNSDKIFDGKEHTAWFQNGSSMPIELIIDLGKHEIINGFKYLPDQTRSNFSKGIIINYSFAVSEDGSNWKEVSQGEFSNIKNSPIWQIKHFDSVITKFVKLSAHSNVADDSIAGYAEIDLISE